MSSQLAEDARAMRAKLAPEGAWTPKALLAFDKNGHAVSSCHPGALRWSLAGAMLSLSPRTERINALVSAMTTACHGYGVARWQELPGRTQAEVLAMLDRVIAAAEAQP